jgi:hypothetical protein
VNFTTPQLHNTITTQHHNTPTTQHHNNLTTQHHNTLTTQHHNTLTTQHHNTLTTQHHNNLTTQHHNTLTTQHHNNLTNVTKKLLLEKSRVTQLMEKIPPFVEAEDSLQCSQEPTTGPYPQPVRIVISRFKIKFNITLIFVRIPQVSFF